MFSMSSNTTGLIWTLPWLYQCFRGRATYKKVGLYGKYIYIYIYLCVCCTISPNIVHLEYTSQDQCTRHKYSPDTGAQVQDHPPYASACLYVVLCDSSVACSSYETTFIQPTWFARTCHGRHYYTERTAPLRAGLNFPTVSLFLHGREVSIWAARWKCRRSFRYRLDRRMVIAWWSIMNSFEEHRRAEVDRFSWELCAW